MGLTDATEGTEGAEGAEGRTGSVARDMGETLSAESNGSARESPPFDDVLSEVRASRFVDDEPDAGSG